MPKILIVDDEWLTRLEIEGMLTDLGYDVAGQAETGAEAVAMARELNPDLILMDVKMPGGMNGIDAAREIKAELGTPIVFISGYGDPEYIEAAKEIAPFGYVMKPFDEREVHAFVEIALSRRKLELELEKSREQLEQTNLDLQNEIAARKQTETELWESRKLYRDIFEKNNAIKWLLDPSSGKIIDANPAACEFYQYKHEEITKLRLWDINIESEADARKLLADASSDGNTEFTFKHRLASGEIRDVQVYTGALESGGKKLLHSIIIDITDRIRAEQSLKHAHHTLEARVESRTTELDKANQQLQEENEMRKRTEDELRKSEEHLRSFMESAKGFIVYRLEIDPQNYFGGRLIFVSPGIEDEIGVSPEAEFSEWFNSVHPEDLPGLVEAQAKSVQNGDTFDREFRWKNIMGEWGWCHAISNPVFDSNGKPKYYNGIVMIVTAQHRAEEALQESEGNLRSLMESASDFAVYRLISNSDNPNFLRVIVVSPSITDIMGVSEPMRFEKWFEHIHPDDVERVVRANIEAFKTNRFDETMRIYHHQEQKWVWIHAISTGIDDHEGQCKYINGILIDITRQKQAENDLGESQQRMALAMEGGNIGMFDWDLQTNETFFDRRWHENLGYSPGDVELNPGAWEKIVHSEDWPGVQQMLKDNLRGKIPFYEKETRLKCKSGQWRWMLTRAKIVEFNNNGDALRIIGTSLDINNRKRMEIELLNKTLELSETNTALKVLVNHREKDKEELGEKVLSNVKALVEPYLKELKDSQVDQKQIVFLDLLESGLKNILSSFSSKLSSKYLALTPGELQVAYLVRVGKRTKEIAELLNLSGKTIEDYRKNLRKKLGIRNTKVNLRTYLLSVQQ